MRVLIGPIIGEVTDRKAKIWLFWSPSEEGEEPPRCHLYRDEGGTDEAGAWPLRQISSSPHNSRGEKGIAAIAEIMFPGGQHEYFFRIIAVGEPVADADRVYPIRPSPAPQEDVGSFSFGLISCSRPLFKPNNDRRHFELMWRHLGRELDNHDCQFLIQAGDQIYADQEQYNAYEMSLGANSEEKRLWYYREAYLKHWEFPCVQEVMSACPQYMIWDDHEIANGWGSDVEHTHQEKPEYERYREVFRAAKQAYLEFQHSHNPDSMRQGRFYYGFHHGPAAFLVLDLRGLRDYGYAKDHEGEDVYPLAGKEQWEDITAWLSSEAVSRARVLFVVTSVPLLHLNRHWTALGCLKNDVRDQWSTDHNKRERRILLQLLLDWMGEAKRPVVILGGDVHVGTVAHLTELQTGKRIHQITSSPIANKPAWLLDICGRILGMFGGFKFHLDSDRRRPAEGTITKRFRKRNFAVINVKLDGDTPRVTLEMYKKKRRRPVVVRVI